MTSREINDNEFFPVLVVHCSEDTTDVDVMSDRFSSQAVVLASHPLVLAAAIGVSIHYVLNTNRGILLRKDNKPYHKHLNATNAAVAGALLAFAYQSGVVHSFK